MGKTSKMNFSIKAIERLDPKLKRYSVLDEQTRGLAIAVYPSGAKTFYHVRKVQGWPKRTTIGAYPDLTIEFARGKGNELNGKLAKWQANDFEGPNPLERPQQTATLGSVLAHYVKNHLETNAKNPAYAVKRANWHFDTYLASLRNHPLGSITREQVRKLHEKIAAERGSVTANRTITFLRTLYNHALHPDVALWSGINPCAKPKKFLAVEKSRERVIKPDEAPKFFKALASEPHRDLRDFLLLALSTAARRGTIFSMRWDEIDWQHELWTISSPKGRRDRKPHVVPLAPLAISVLKTRPHVSAEWVFAGRKGRHLTTVKKPWKKFLQRAGIEDLTLHDLRRTLATQQGQTGASREVIQKTLGHEASSVATKIYDRSDRRPEVRAAMNKAVSSLLVAGKTSRRKLLKAAKS